MLGLWSLSRTPDGAKIMAGTTLSIILGGLCAIAFIGLAAATSWNLMKKRWLHSIVSFCLLAGCCYSLNMTLAHQFLFAADGTEINVVREEISETSTTQATSPTPEERVEEKAETDNEDTINEDTMTESMESSMMEFYKHKEENNLRE